MEEELKELESKSLLRSLKRLSSPQGREVQVNSKKLLNFSSNDYLGLAGRFSKECFEKWGTGSGASRLVCGNFTVHEELEAELARVKKTESALLFSSGYMANIGVISTLVRSGDAVFSDELNHASIVDACRLSRAKVFVYPHADVETLEFMLSRERRNFRRCLIVTDSVFSMDGDIAPLPALLELSRLYDAVLFVDDAHATGVVGWSSFDFFGLEPDERVVIMGTLGKALGTFGSFVCGSRVLRDYLINRCRTFIFTTALPPSLACQTAKNMKLVPDRMRVLNDRIHYFSRLTGRFSHSAIFPILLDTPQEALELSAFLFERGFFVPAIRPPAVKRSRLRVTITCAHSQSDLLALWQALSDFRERRG
jgi:8-amino-7-oxononanoate synthase